MKSAHAIYIEYLEKDREKDIRWKLKEMTEKEQKQKEILIKEKELHTSELLKTANGNFDEALDYGPLDKNSVQVGKVMSKKSSKHMLRL